MPCAAPHPPSPPSGERRNFRNSPNNLIRSGNRLATRPAVESGVTAYDSGVPSPLPEPEQISILHADAELPLIVALSSCPASTCNGGAPIKPLAYQILEE